MPELCKEPFLDLTFDADAQILFASWKGYQSFDTCTAGGIRMLEAIEQYRIAKVLNDNMLVRGLWMDAAQWGARVWFPRAKQSGLKRFAWVYSPARFSQISVDTALASMNPDDYGVEVFYSAEEALAWLRSVR